NFKEVSAAFDILGDAERRKKFDKGELDNDGRERPTYRQYQGRPGAGGPGAGQWGSAEGFGFETRGGQSASFEDLGDIFADLFGSGAAGGRPGAGGRGGFRGKDLRYRLEVDFLDAIKGATKRVTMPDNRTLDITIPAGLEDGQTLRLRGQGEKGPGNGP